MEHLPIIIGITCGIFTLVAASFGLGAYSSRFVRKDEYRKDMVEIKEDIKTGFRRVHDRIDTMGRA